RPRLAVHPDATGLALADWSQLFRDLPLPPLAGVLLFGARPAGALADERKEGGQVLLHAVEPEAITALELEDEKAALFGRLKAAHEDPGREFIRLLGFRHAVGPDGTVESMAGIPERM